MSVITYAGITLPYALTTNFSQVRERDELGDVDPHVTRFDISVQCVINKTYLQAVSPVFAAAGVVPANSADLMNLIRQTLLQPRKVLTFTVNGINMIPGFTAPPIVSSGGEIGRQGTVDSRNGPKPQGCNILTLGEETFLLTYHISTWWMEQNNPVNVGVSPTTTNKPTNDVLFNRWSERVTMDQNQYTTRTRVGSYRIRSDTAAGMQADVYRFDMASVGIPAGFQRESSDYEISADGLTLSYKVVDKEYFKVPPRPAMRATGEFTITYANLGAMKYGACRVRLEGGRYADQDVLLFKAVAIATQKLMINGATTDGLLYDPTKGARFARLTGGYIRIGMWENWVEVFFQAQLMMDKGRKVSTGSSPLAWTESEAQNQSDIADAKAEMFFNMTFTPKCDFIHPPPSQQGPPKPPEEQAPVYYERGSQYWLLQAAAYWDPALNQRLSQNDPAQVAAPIVTNYAIPPAQDPLAAGEPNIPPAAGDGQQQNTPGTLIGQAGRKAEV